MKRSYLEACRYSVVDGASGLVGVECAVEPWAMGPYCSGAWFAGGKPAHPWTVLVFVASVLACHIDFLTWSQMSRICAETEQLVRLVEHALPRLFLGGSAALAAHADVSRHRSDTLFGSCVAVRAAC